MAKEDDPIIRTTIRLPKSLLAAAKHRGIDEGSSFQDVVIRALEAVPGQERRTTVRGDGRIFRRKRSPFWWCEYYLHGKQVRESTATADPDRAAKYLKRRLREVENDRDGIRDFVGPQAGRIRVWDLLEALKADYRLRGKWNARSDSTFKKVSEHFGRSKVVDLGSEAVADCNFSCARKVIGTPPSIASVRL